MDKSKGLSSQEAKSLLLKLGLNQLPSKNNSSLFKLLISQFRNILSLILIGAGFLSFLIGDSIDGVLILVILLLNSGLGFWQEYKASKELEALRKLEVSSSRVIRDGKELQMPSFNIVPGDVVVLESGDKIPADGYLIESYDFLVNEASLTGESLPVLKTVNINNNQLFFGTTVTSGRGKFEVTQTGTKTRFGSIALNLATVEEEPTPLEISLDSLGKRVGILAVVIALLVFGIRFFQGENFLEVLFSSIALMVAAVPEGLPAVITVLLAIGVSRMYQQKTLIRRMSAIESLGATSLICTDKTGTLTKNEMTVRQVILASPNSDSAFKAATLCNSSSLVLKEDGSFNVLGDTTEGALLIWAKNQGVEIEELRSKGKIEEEIPFSLQRRMMSVLWDEKGKQTLYSKGAPEVILSFCKLSEEKKAKYTKVYKQMASIGFRVIALASKFYDGQKIEKITDLEKDLEFIGLIGIADEARPEAKDAIARARKAGIELVMITGDNELTAKSIAQEVGLLRKGDEIINGAQLKELTDEQLKEQIGKIRIFARVIPEDKLRIVKALQSLGHVVAVTGDGVNDALALKQAQVGVAMGKTGTDVAKESADIIILDDNLSTIINAVEQGRTVYNNISKTVRFLMTGNLSEVLVIIAAVVVGLPNPFLTVQLLWINFVTDGLPALSLAADKPSHLVMSAPPRDKDKKLLDKSSFQFILTSGAAIAALVLAVFVYCLNTYGVQFARSAAFTAMVVLQMAFIFLMRRHHSPWSNKYLLSSVGLVLIMQVLILFYPPLRAVFKL